MTYHTPHRTVSSMCTQLFRIWQRRMTWMHIQPVSLIMSRIKL
jgi:hypothetical protein